CVCYTNAKHRYVSGLTQYKGFHVIRDPRDIVVSAYYSHLHSHPTNGWPELARHRELLTSISKEEGLSCEMEFLRREFEDMQSWDYSMPYVLEIKLETLVQNPYVGFLEILRHLEVLANNQDESEQFEGGPADSLSDEAIVDI